MCTGTVESHIRHPCRVVHYGGLIAAHGSALEITEEAHFPWVVQHGVTSLQFRHLLPGPEVVKNIDKGESSHLQSQSGDIHFFSKLQFVSIKLLLFASESPDLTEENVRNIQVTTKFANLIIAFGLSEQWNIGLGQSLGR